MKAGKAPSAAVDDSRVEGAPDGTASLPQPRSRDPLSPLNRGLLTRFQRRLGSPPMCLVLWNGLEIPLSPEPSVAKVRVRDWRTLARIALDPAVQVGEAYAEGALEVQGDLAELVEAVFQRWRDDGRRPGSWLRRLGALRGSSRHDVQYHYDIGNDFYRLWLDERLLYTCAYFTSPSVGLEEAQVAKMDHVCRKLRLMPGERVLEAGCGWGAQALHMAARYGASVTACNVSREQIRYARERAREQGLDHLVRFVEDDYRNVNGRFDAFVSVGMLEHVGSAHYRDLGRVIHECLEPERGRGLLHFIGRNRPTPLNAWIRRRIFPGAYPPVLSEVFRQVLEPWSFSVLDVENLRLHYARTLEHWLSRFEAAASRVARTFDEAFVRTWRLYLAGSRAAFSTGSLQLFQVVFSRPRSNDVPWTRAAQYLDTTTEPARAEL